MSLIPSAQAQPVSQEAASGKSDMLVVVRDGKGDIPASIPDLLRANN
jgi:hypothetical protein